MAPRCITFWRKRRNKKTQFWSPSLSKSPLSWPYFFFFFSTPFVRPNLCRLVLLPLATILGIQAYVSPFKFKTESSNQATLRVFFLHFFPTYHTFPLTCDLGSIFWVLRAIVYSNLSFLLSLFFPVLISSGSVPRCLGRRNRRLSGNRNTK